MTLATATPARAPVEEIRLAVVLNGGVSLAVWMGGVVQELNRLTWAESEPDGAYAAALGAVESTARADVIAGTSAGGINGAALALGQVNGTAQLTRLRGLWVEQGNIDALLRKPFRGQPTSLLQATSSSSSSSTSR
jgi:predicted acylesterase/phospholipase RssA